MPIIEEAPTMICGIDVFHKTLEGKKSVLGFCSSLNRSATKFWSKTVLHDVGVEISTGLQALMEKALKKFMRVNNNRHPARVIVYRDGVGEKQLQTVSEVEITQI